jgi:hypothetical protein
VNGFDFVVLAILSTTAIVIIAMVAKACQNLKKDGRRGPSLLEIKPAPQPISRQHLNLENSDPLRSNPPTVD